MNIIMVKFQNSHDKDKILNISLENKKIFIVCNFYEHEKEFSYEMSKNSKAEILISNYNNSSLDLKKIKLRSYEAIMYEVKEGKV